MSHDSQHHHPAIKPNSCEGLRYKPSSDAELHKAMDQAFDYRGDITLKLRNGSECIGFLYNRDHASGRADLFVASQPTPVFVRYSEVEEIVFSGDDMAFGKSWDDWADKNSHERKAEAEALRRESEKLGHL